MPHPSRRADPAFAADAPETARLTGVTFGYADAPDVLRDVNLTLPRGSFHFLTGPSGAGKTSLLRLLMLAARPERGSIELFGEDAGAAPRSSLPAIRRRIGVVFQDFRLLDHLSVFDNAALPLRLAGKRAPTWAEDVDEMLEWVGLAHRRDVRPGILSGGEKQRLAIARAVMAGPELILADEPTGNVDAAMAERLLKLFESLHRMGTTVLIATHDRDLAKAAGASILRLNRGRLEKAR